MSAKLFKGDALLNTKAGATVAIQNVVVTANLNQNIDLKAILKAYPNADYRPENFPGLVYKLKRPKTSTLIFASGKMVCTGAKSEHGAKRAVRKGIAESS